MKIPLDWLGQYVEINKSAKQIADSFTALGLMLDKPVVKTDFGEVLDLEHRMDRSDWLSIIGCARDYAAFEKIQLKFPEIDSTNYPMVSEEDAVKIEVTTDKVVRFNTRVFKNVTVRESPAFIKRSLEAYGIPSINNIVDITNFVMVELGQPMHAQDLMKMEAREIVIRDAHDGEEMTTLLGETVRLTHDQFVLTQNGKATVLGGIVGGKSTGVDANTTEIVLDAGNYDQVNIRRSSRALKIINETVSRYDKYLHPKLTQTAIERATYLILKYAGGECHFNFDYYPNPIPENEMQLRYSRISRIGGIEIEPQTVKRTLLSLGYEILEENETILKLKIPYFRTDVVVEDDLVADILRIHDYGKIEPLPIVSAPPKEITPEIYNFENKLRDILVKIGCQEHITSSLTTHNPGDEEQIALENAVSSDVNALRNTIFDNLKNVVRNYLKHNKSDFTIFEIGKVFRHNTEFYELEIVHSGTGGSYENNKHLKSVVYTLLSELGVTDVHTRQTDFSADLYQEELQLGQIRLNRATFNTNALLSAKKENRVVKHDFSVEKYEDRNFELKFNEYVSDIVKKLISEPNVDRVEEVATHIKDDSKVVTLRVYFIS